MGVLTNTELEKLSVMYDGDKSRDATDKIRGFLFQDYVMIRCLLQEHVEYVCSEYLEDVDVSWRARIYGLRNMYVPAAVVRHVGSATSGSVYNEFKVRHASRNSIYLIYKNMPVLQILWNLPFLILGFLIKMLFFVKKGYGKEYITGLAKGFALCRRDKKVQFCWKHLRSYLKIQWELWVNVIRRAVDF